MRTASVAALLVALAVPAAAQEAAPLKWNLKAGDTLYVKTTADNDMKVEVMGQAIPMRQKMSTVLRMKVKDATEAGKTVEFTYVEMKMDLGAQAQAAGVGAIGDRFKGATLTATFGKDDQVTKLAGYDDFLDKISGGDDTQKKMMGAMMSEDTIKQTLGQVFLPLSAKPVKAGDTWTRDEKVPFAGFGTLTTKRKLTLEKEAAGVATIKESADVTFKAGGGKGAGGLPFEIAAGDLEIKNYKGTHQFDAKAGRLKSSAVSMSMSGTMSVEANGMKIDLGISGTTDTKVEVSEKNPAAGD